MNQCNKYLYLIWKDPQTRRNFTIGKLCKSEKYTFEYSDDFSAAEKHGWTKLDVFPEEKIYESEYLFPIFASRLPDRKRRDIDKILNKYSLCVFDEFELLRKSGARLPIDTYSFIDPIFPEDETIEREFFIMGMRHRAPCQGNDCEKLPTLNIGDELYFKEEPDNTYDPNAVQIYTHDNILLGYVPRYYNVAIIDRLNKEISFSCKITDINCNQDCSECIKVKLEIPRKP